MRHPTHSYPPRARFCVYLEVAERAGDAAERGRGDGGSAPRCGGGAPRGAAAEATHRSLRCDPDGRDWPAGWGCSVASTLLNRFKLTNVTVLQAETCVIVISCFIWGFLDRAAGEV